MADIERIKQRVQYALDYWKAPSIAVGIVKDGKVVLNTAYGYRNIDQKLPANEDSIYRIASCSKAFTATALAKLVDEGKLFWDSKVKDIAPEIQFYDDYTNNNVTVRDLLCHRTGLPENEPMLFRDDITRESIIEKLKYVKPSWPIRTHWCYNNACYVAAGVIVEKISGMSWEQYVEENITKPLGMDRTFFYLEDWENKDDNFCTPYNPGADGPVECENLTYSAEDKSKGIGAPMGPAGSMASTINDMLKWVNFNLNQGEVDGIQLISKKVMKELHKPQMVMDSLFGLPYPDEDLFSYGLGWFIESYRGHKIVNHSGGIHGFGTLVWMVPDINLGMVFITNVVGNMSRFALVNEVVDEFIDAEKTDWQKRFMDFIQQPSNPEDSYIDSIAIKKKENTTPSHPLIDYTGTYYNDVAGKVEIQLENNQLVVHSMALEGKLAHFHYDSFTVTESNYYLDGCNVLFQMDKKGDIASFEMPVDIGVNEVFKKQ